MKKLLLLIVIAIMVITLSLISLGCNATATTEQTAAETAAETEAETAAETEAETAAETVAEEPIKIGFCFPTLQEERWNIEKDLAIEKCEELGVELLIQDGNNDVTVQNEQVENLITQGADVLIIGPVEVKGTAAAVEAAYAAGIPVISYLRMIDSDKLACTVSYDFVGIGRVKAAAAVDAGVKGNYALICGAESDSVSFLLKDGYYESIQPGIDSGDINVVFEVHVLNWDPVNALADCENALTQNNNDIQAFICSNDNLAGAAVQALTAQNMVGETFVTGMDCDISACQRIVEGKQACTILFTHQQLIDNTISAAIQLANGETPVEINGEAENALGMVPAVLLIADLVNKENMDELVIDGGIHSREDVYKNVSE